MKIIILDGYTLNPGDLNWAPLEALGDLTIYDRTTSMEVLERAEGAEYVLTNKVALTREMMVQMPALKYIGVMATGYNHIDLEAASELGITVTNVAGYSTNAVAQHTFALILSLLNRVETHSHLVHEGRWAASKDFTFRETPLFELAGKTLGLVGLGDIGHQVAVIGKAFGMRVLAYRKSPFKTTDADIRMVSLQELFAESDVVSLHLPLSTETEQLVNQQLLQLMKPGAYLINTSRGPLINEADLAEALEKGHLAGAGLDVLSTEPPAENNPLLGVKNCIITPHIAWSLHEARARLIHLIAENILAYRRGESLNRVNI